MTRPAPPCVAVGVLFVFFAFAGIGCDDDDPDSNDSPGSPSPSPFVLTRIEQTDFEFVPPTLGISTAREELSIEITNNGSTDHTFTIDGLGLDEVLSPGDTEFVVLSEPGDYEFYCRFHRDQGMIGGLGYDLESRPSED